MAVHELFAYICVNDAAAAIKFYEKAFGAKEKLRLVEPGGRIGHAEVDFNGPLLMISEQYPEYGIVAPAAGEGRYLTLHLHVDNADETIAQAIAAGATMDNPISDSFYGERGGSVRDPFGHRWSIGHSIEKVEPEEMQRRYTALMKKG